VFSKEVAVESDKVDRYRREVGKVLVGGLDVNLEQVKRGMAWHYKSYAKEQPKGDRGTYAAAEETARAQRVGLWSDATSVPPWDFRHAGKRKRETE
jgi:endonuclease YncB( thermonuclease family)